MDAIIGKNKNIFIFLSIIFFINLYAGDISLRVTSIDNQPLQEAGVGQPFLVHVVIKNSSNTAQRPTIKESQHVLLRPAGFHMNMVNNNTSITYHYETRIDSAGTYTLGPASIMENGTLVESKPITVTVTTQQKLQQPPQATNDKSQTLLRLTCDKEKVVVGQKVHCTLTFYTTDARITLHDIKKPDLTDGYSIKSSNNSSKGQETINNTDYAYIRWEWDIIPTKPGTCTIPAYAADFSCPTPHHFFPMLIVQGDTKRIYSNSVHCTVDPLPAGNMQPLFIGTITSMHAKIESSSAKVGQGIVYSLSITGDGDFDTVTQLSLKNMPDNLKWYESTQSCVAAPHNPLQSCYTHDYIIQALQPGTYRIPEQILPYFDTQTHTYKTVKTMPIEIVVHPDNAIKKNSPSNPVPAADTDEIRPLHENGSWYTPVLIPIPWPVFWLLAILLCICLIITAIIKSKRLLMLPVLTFFAQRTLYAHTKKRIKQAHTQGNYEEFYEIFMHFLSQYTHISMQALTTENIDQFLLAQNSMHRMQDWQSFFSQLIELKFYAKKTDLPQNLTEQALHWIDVFAQLKRVHQ